MFFAANEHLNTTAGLIMDMKGMLCSNSSVRTMCVLKKGEAWSGKDECGRAASIQMRAMPEAMSKLALLSLQCCVKFIKRRYSAQA